MKKSKFSDSQIMAALKKGLGLLLCLLQASGLAGLVEKLAEIFGPNRLQHSTQRWALA